MWGKSLDSVKLGKITELTSEGHWEHYMKCCVKNPQHGIQVLKGHLLLLLTLYLITSGSQVLHQLNSSKAGTSSGYSK